MKSFTDSTEPRRHFIARAAAALAAITGIPSLARGETLSPNVTDDSKHDQWIHQLKGKHRELFHTIDFNDRAMLMASNFLSVYESDFGAKPGEANAVIGIHGPALTLGFTDAAWSKYALGKAINVTDPTTKEFATRNIYARGAELTVDSLQKRGVLFIMCNHGLTLRSRAIATERGEPFETVYNDLAASRLPGIVLVPAMVIAINRAQEKGITYVRV